MRIWTTNEEIVKIILKKLENMYVSDYIIYRKHYAYTDNYYFYTVSLFEYVKWKLRIS